MMELVLIFDICVAIYRLVDSSLNAAINIKTCNGYRS